MQLTSIITNWCKVEGEFREITLLEIVNINRLSFDWVKVGHSGSKLIIVGYSGS